jgi:hypothetical protein
MFLNILRSIFYILTRNTSKVFLIPFFEKYPISGIKYLDFADFCQVAELMKESKHLTKEGLEEIKRIKQQMNSGRAKLLTSQAY